MAVEGLEPFTIVTKPKDSQSYEHLHPSFHCCSLLRFSFHCIVINLTIWARCRETLGTLKYETYLFVLRLQFLFQVAVRRPPGIAGIVYLLLITCLWSLRQFMSLSLRVPIICRGKLLLQCRNFLFRQCRPLQSNQTANWNLCPYVLIRLFNSYSMCN